jgi:hypothetical protein
LLCVARPIHKRKRDPEDQLIANFLEGLASSHIRWEFGLMYLHFRNQQGAPWNHQRVIRSYCEMELNLQIKPKKMINKFSAKLAAKKQPEPVIATNPF